MVDPHPTSDLSAVPLFPLPNVVLFPYAILPLHIFEERYKEMTADAIAGNRQIAMALLKPGWEKNYYQRPAVEPVVCVGTIVSHERLGDGKYNFLLRGHTRARIVRESSDKSYRVAEVAPLEETRPQEEKFAEHRMRLISIFDQGTLLATDLGRQLRQLLSSPLPTSAIADLIAFKMLDDVSVKQSILSDGDVHRRVTRIVDAFEELRPVLQPVSRTAGRPGLN